MVSQNLQKSKNFASQVHNLLTQVRFRIPPKSKAAFEAQLKNPRRYVFIVGEHYEDGRWVERFLKIPETYDAVTRRLFKRQIAFADFFKKNGIKTRGVVEFNTDRRRGLPFVIMETFPRGHAKVGFIGHTDGAAMLKSREAEKCMENLFRLHEIPVMKVSKELLKMARRLDSRYIGFRQKMTRIIDQKVLPADAKGGKRELLHKVMERRIGMPTFRKQVMNLLEYWRPLIVSYEHAGDVLVHGDLAPSNLYVYDSGEVEFLDLEWVGVCSNPILALARDFGNLRARAWDAPEFKTSLDELIIAHFKDKGKPEIGRAIVSLGILVSHGGLPWAFENYPLVKQRKADERRRRLQTEADLPKAWQYL